MGFFKDAAKEVQRRLDHKCDLQPTGTFTWEKKPRMRCSICGKTRSG